MTQAQLSTFVSNDEEVIAVLFALVSLSALEAKLKAPIVLMPQPVFDDFEAKYPDIKLKHIFNKLKANLVLGFAKGYNWNLGFRPALGQIAKRVEAGSSLCYFSPRMIFYHTEFLENFASQTWAARQPDDFWPKRDLYGPSHEEIWQAVLDLGGAKLEDFVEDEFPAGYWRRYPAASPHLFYTPFVEEFVEIYSSINDELAQRTPPALEGLGNIPKEAVIAATIAKMEGDLIDPLWDWDLMYYPNFYNLMLRVKSNQFEGFQNNILENNILRRVLKSIDEYKLIFYQNKLIKVRENLDIVEQNFSILRMEQLIERRRLRQQVRKRLRAVQMGAGG